MSEGEQALVAPQNSAARISVPDERLRPTTRGREAITSFGVYLLAVAVAAFIAPTWGVLGVVVGAFAFIAYRRRSWFRANAQHRAIQVALGNDEVEQAAIIGERLMRSHRLSGFAHAMSVSVWAVVELRRGEPERTIELLRRTLKSGRFKGRVGRAVEAWRIDATLAYALAIVGDTDQANTYLDRAKARIEPERLDALLTIRLCTLCRAGKAQAAIQLLDAKWRTAETMLTVGGARTARMFEAFALEQVHGLSYRDTAADRAQRALDRAREARRGAHDYIAVRWPELQDFLRRHGMDGEQSAATE